MSICKCYEMKSFSILKLTVKILVCALQVVSTKMENHYAKCSYLSTRYIFNYNRTKMEIKTQKYSKVPLICLKTVCS